MQSETSPSVTEWLRARVQRRGTAIILALIIEILIILMLLGMVPSFSPKAPPKKVVFGLKVDDPGNAPKASQQQKAKAAKSSKSQQSPQPQTETTPPPPETPPPPVVPVTNSAPAFLVLSRRDFASGDISKMRSAAPTGQSASNDSDSDTGGASGEGDTPHAGRGPHGETLYAAEWYREPTNGQLNPYVNRQRGLDRNGYGEIACRTISRYQVTDCQELGETPRGSGYAGSARQAAFQFLVKPPRVNGKLMVGEWVRIRITYTFTHKKSDGPGGDGPGGDGSDDGR